MAEDISQVGGKGGSRLRVVDRIEQIVMQEFDLRPYFIIKTLGLIDQAYLPLAKYGHMGREDLGVRWEDTDRIEALRAAAGL